MNDISARQLRLRADEARAIAGQMKHRPTQRTMWQLAVSYDLLARHAEERENRTAPSTDNQKPDNRAA